MTKMDEVIELLKNKDDKVVKRIGSNDEHDAKN